MFGLPRYARHSCVGFRFLSVGIAHFGIKIIFFCDRISRMPLLSFPAHTVLMHHFVVHFMLLDV